MALKRKSGAAVRKWDGSPFRVLAFDPGGTTGWAYASGGSSTGLDFGYDSGQIGPHEHHSELWSFLEAQWAPLPSTPLEITFESFEYRNLSRSGLVLVSKEYIGIIKLFCQHHDITPTERTASAAKHMISDDKIHALGLWKPSRPHAMDATRHLLTHLVVGKGIREPITDKWLGE